MTNTQIPTEDRRLTLANWRHRDIVRLGLPRYSADNLAGIKSELRDGAGFALVHDLAGASESADDMEEAGRLERTEQPLDVVMKAERLVAEGPGGIEHPVAIEKPGVPERNGDPAFGQDLPIELGDAFVAQLGHDNILPVLGPFLAAGSGAILARFRGTTSFST